MLEQVVRTKGNRLAPRLERNQLIRTMVPEAAGMHGVPRKIIVLSERGLQEVERFQTKLIRYELDPYRIRQSHIRHLALAQQATANMLGPTFDFLTERELSGQSKKEVKQPDILWLINGNRIAVEVELTAKWDRHLDQFALGTIRSLLPSADAPARFDLIFLLTDSPAIRDRYKQRFEPGYLFNLWGRDGTLNTDKWKITGQLAVPSELAGKVVCRLFD